jgi:hypothetical protein
VGGQTLLCHYEFILFPSTKKRVNTQKTSARSAFIDKQMLPTQQLRRANPFTENKHTVNYSAAEHIQQRCLMAWLLLPLLLSRCTSFLLLLFLFLSFQSDIDCHIMGFHSGESTHFSSPEYFHYVTLSADCISHQEKQAGADGLRRWLIVLGQVQGHVRKLDTTLSFVLSLERLQLLSISSS